MDQPRARAPRLVIFGGIAATICIAIGSLWDTMIHIRAGHTLLAPAHLFIIASAFLFTASAFISLFVLRHSDPVLKLHLKTVVWGGAILFVALTIVDELWHIFFGLDTSGWSPPHLMFWGGSLVELFGLAMLERWCAGEYHGSSQPIKIRISKILISSSFFSVLLFLFLEFDVPHSNIAKMIPGYTYAVASTTIFVSGILIVARVLNAPFATTIAAALAWLFFWLTGATIEYLTDFSFVMPPFPIILPAFLLDVVLKFGWRGNLPMSRKQYLEISLFLSSACYWLLIGWARFITKLPQQLSGTPIEWMIWFVIFVPPISIISGYTAWRVSQHIRRLEESSQQSAPA